MEKTFYAVIWQDLCYRDFEDFGTSALFKDLSEAQAWLQYCLEEEKKDILEEDIEEFNYQNIPESETNFFTIILKTDRIITFKISKVKLLEKGEKL